MYGHVQSFNQVRFNVLQRTELKKMFWNQFQCRRQNIHGRMLVKWLQYFAFIGDLKITCCCWLTSICKNYKIRKQENRNVLIRCVIIHCTHPSPSTTKEWGFWSLPALLFSGQQVASKNFIIHSVAAKIWIYKPQSTFHQKENLKTMMVTYRLSKGCNFIIYILHCKTFKATTKKRNMNASRLRIQVQIII